MINSCMNNSFSFYQESSMRRQANKLKFMIIRSRRVSRGPIVVQAAAAVTQKLSVQN